MSGDSAPPPAPFWRRYIAWSLDFSILAAAAIVLAWPQLLAGWRQSALALRLLAGLSGRAVADELSQAATPALLAQRLLDNPQFSAASAMLQSGVGRMALWWLLAYVLLAAPYHIGFERSAWHGSPGKHLLHLRVDGVDTSPVSLPRSVVRHFAGALSWLTLNLGHASAALPPHKRALHDYVAGTRVVDASGGSRLPAWAWLWLLAQAAAGFALLAWAMQRAVAAVQSALV